MGPRAAIALAALSAILLLGCSADDGANGGAPDLGLATNDLGAFSDAAFCSSNIVITTDPPPATMGGFVYAPVDLIATATSPGTLEMPSWTVSLADGASFFPTVVDPQSGLTVKFHAPLPGSYTFRVNFSQAGCPGMASIDVHTQNARQLDYRLRISPPDTAGVPQQDRVVTVFGGTSQSDFDVHLVAGTLLAGTLKTAGGAGTGGEIRLIADSGPDALATTGSDGTFTLSVSADSYYTPLVVPQSALLAPRLLARATGAALAGSAFVVDGGETVSGTIVDPGDAAIAGARVVLRSGSLPSGTGLSAADGSYALRAEPGSFVASIGADGWPELTLPGVTVPSAALSLDVKYLVGRVALSGKVLASDGTTAIAGARVTIRSASLPGVATVSVGGAPQAASGRINQVAVSAADGTLPALQLPPLASGSYQVLIEPPAGATDGMTLLSMPLSSAGHWDLVLAKKIRLSGTVKDLLGSGVGDVRVTAFESAGLGAAPWTMTTADGAYALDVDPGTPLVLLAEPPGRAQLSSARVPLAAGATQADASLGPGLLIGGTIYAPGGGHMPAVVIDALCATCGSTTPIASALSNASGGYSLYLPDPGIDLGDGGLLDASP